MTRIDHRYYVRLLPWTLQLTDEVLTIRALWGATRVPRDGVLRVGIARDERFGGGDNPLSIGDETIRLENGPHGCVIVYEVDDGEDSVAFTFDPRDRDAVAIVEAIVGDADEFLGVGQSHAIRARMGLAAGDIGLALVLLVLVGSVVYFLQYQGCM